MRHWFLKNPNGKIILQPWYLVPNYQDIPIVKAQIRWCKETARYYLKEDFDYFLFKECVEMSEALKKELKRLAR
jgi:hypothetical protein